MKILFSAEHFYPFVGGAEISMYTLLNRLAEKHEVHAVFSGSSNLEFKERRIAMHQRRVIGNLRRDILPYARDFYLNKKWKTKLRKEVKNIEPELVFTQLRFAPSVVALAYELNVKTVLFIRSYEFFCPTDFVFGCNENCWKCIPWWGKDWFFIKLSYPFFKKMFEWHKNAIKQASLMVSNSKYTRTIVKKWFGVDSDVLYPSIDLNNYKASGRDAKYVTFPKPYEASGVDIFIEIAKKLKDEEFLVCGDPPRKVLVRIKRLNNVTFIHKTSDMRRVYSQTRLLLVPTIRPEPFGRVAIEAMINGIPCIVSNRGGLPEAVGDTGEKIEHIYDIEKWTGAIKKYDNKDYYHEMSKKAEKHAQKFDSRIVFKKFQDLVANKLGIYI